MLDEAIWSREIARLNRCGSVLFGDWETAIEFAKRYEVEHTGGRNLSLRFSPWGIELYWDSVTQKAAVLRLMENIRKHKKSTRKQPSRKWHNAEQSNYARGIVG